MKVTAPAPSNLMQKIIDAATPYAVNGTVPEDKMLAHIDHSHIEIVEGSEQAYDLIVREIKKAKKQILIQAFVWVPSTQVVKDIRNALCEIKHEVDVFLLVDQLERIARLFFLGEMPPQKAKHDLVSLGLEGLPDNIKLHIGTYSHNSQASNHNKAIWIDGSLIITGANLQPENYGPNGFHDSAMLVPKGAAEAAFYDFKSMWDNRTNKFEDVDCTPTYSTEAAVQSNNFCPMLYVTNTIRQWPAVLPLYRASLPKDPLNNAYISAINNAQHIIRIAVPNLNSPEIMQALIQFINERNGRVELLMGKEFNEFREKVYGGTNQNSVDSLFSMIDSDKEDRLDIRWFVRSNREKKAAISDVIHMKFMAVDNQVVIYGSANLDFISLHNCHETNMIIDSASFARRATSRLFSSIFERGAQATPDRGRGCYFM